MEMATDKPVEDLVKTQELLKKAKEEADAERAMMNEEQLAVQAYLEKHKDRVAMWAKDHKNQFPPVYYLRDKKEVIWLNRKQARAAQRKQNRQKGRG